MEKAAKADPKAQKELDESLRSLGLRPAKNRKRTAPGVSDNQRDIRDSGSRSSAPPSYREQETERYPVLSWGMEVGDCVVFHPSALHGNLGNRSARRSRRIAAAVRQAEWPRHQR